MIHDLIDNDDAVTHLFLLVFPCTNVAWNKNITTTTQNTVETSRLQTDIMVDGLNCLPNKAMHNPEIVIDFEVETEVRFLHIFLKPWAFKCE